MARLLVSVVSFLVLASVAQATPSLPTRGAPVVDRVRHNYWLSDGLNRLAFWQPSPATRPNPQKSR